jgi:hypothetical protein
VKQWRKADFSARLAVLQEPPSRPPVNIKIEISEYKEEEMLQMNVKLERWKHKCDEMNSPKICTCEGRREA